MILKLLLSRLGENVYFCGTNRYYTLEHFPKCNDSTQIYSTSLNNVKNLINDVRYNNDPLGIPFHELFIRMTDEERDDVYRICSDCLGQEVKLGYVEPGNSMSDSFLQIDGTPLAQASSGTRMLVLLVSILLFKRFEYVLIDEPELGLTPRIQNSIQRLIYEETETDGALSHLKHIYIATHSHIFLNRRRLADNFLVKRTNNSIGVKRLTNHEEFRNLQFTQLGNSFEQLQLPSGFIIVEGKTDYEYINRLVHLKFPANRVNIVTANGDGQVKQKVHDLIEVIGDLDSSPYCNRVLVILDETHTPTLQPTLEKMGLPKKNVIVWKQNGIEYYYPETILRKVFEDDSLLVSDLCMENDVISHNGINKRKVDLSKAVLERMNGSEELDPELNSVLEMIKLFC